jgi:hypothetical protein
VAVAYFIDYSVRDVTAYNVVDIAAYLLKADIVKPAGTAVAK